MAINVFLFGQSSEREGILMASFRSEDGFRVVGGTEKESDVVGAIDSLRAKILALYYDGSDTVYRVAQQVYALRPSVIVIAIVRQGLTEEQVRNLLSCGISGSFLEDSPHAAIVDGIRRSVSIEAGRMEAIKPPADTCAPGWHHRGSRPAQADPQRTRAPRAGITAEPDPPPWATRAPPDTDSPPGSGV